ncbi:MAG: hypothetical protein SO155_08630 [Candidatus Ventricola sp.]|nr:hypothetical protein [Candidatus Ventricola sp.]
MIDAIFDRHSRSAAVSGVYQYDTGQRLRLRGLPSPDEMLERDTMLSGDAVTVQAQFAYDGDSQTEPRLAAWDEDLYAWLVDIPDAYLTRSETVRVFVEVYYGADENGARTKTMYEGVFRPISRPASNDTATDDQLSAWETLAAEVDLVLSTAGPAQQNAVSQAESAVAAANAAQDSADNAQEVAQNTRAATDALVVLAGTLVGMTVQTETLEAGSTATAALSGNVLTLGIPRGADGAKGETGDTGPADITLSFSDGVLTITPK